MHVALGLLAKKAFCSWICPIGTLSEMLAALSRRLFRRTLSLPRLLDLPLRSLKYLLLAFFVHAVFWEMSPQSVVDFLDSPYTRAAAGDARAARRDPGAVAARRAARRLRGARGRSLRLGDAARPRRGRLAELDHERGVRATGACDRLACLRPRPGPGPEPGGVGSGRDARSSCGLLERRGPAGMPARRDAPRGATLARGVRLRWRCG